jgi:uncharacterized protein YacL
MVLHMVRAVFVLVVLALTVSYAFQPNVIPRDVFYVMLYILMPFLAAVGLVAVDMLWRRKRLHVLSGLFFGVLAGLVLGYVMALIVDLLVQVFPGIAEPETLQLVKALLGAALVFLCVTFVLQTKDDFRFVIPYVQFSRETQGARPLLLDTSVIIDGRIADIGETRILESKVVVPRFILAELQAIADSDDKLKRNRGRRGLDILNRLQGSEAIDIQILDPHVNEVDEALDADAKLVALAEHLDGRVVTNDYNLNKVAQLRGVDVININDLANALKPIVLPGESMSVKVIKPGEESGQGVGYLEDGTMVVAEHGRDHIGRQITIVVTSVLQTSAGRMIFGRLDTDGTVSRGPRRGGK